jgi:MFS family permease
MSPLIGLACNLATGWFATRWPMGRLLGVAMLVLTAALLVFPLVQTLAQVYLYGAILAAAGGMVTVLFFGVWGQAYGPAHLGKIQGTAQMLTVLASALGPRLLASCQRWTGSYVPIFYGGAAVAAALALAAWLVPLPKAGEPPPASTAKASI